MATNLNITGNLEAALDVFRNGYVPVAMLPGRKVPAEFWKRWNSESMTEDSINERWQHGDHGLALLCRGMVVFDVDDASKLGHVIAKSGLEKAPICRTPGGGFHVHGRAREGVEVARQIRVGGEPIDLLTAMSLSIIPPSRDESGTPYVWLGAGLPPLADLPFAQVGWVRDSRRQPTPMVVDADGSARSVCRARAYLARIHSVSGERGHDMCFRAACKCREFGLTPEQTLTVLLNWNETNALPPWSQAELLHKVDDVFKLRG